MNNENNNAVLDEVLSSEESGVNRLLLNYLSNNGALDNIINETRAQVTAGQTIVESLEPEEDPLDIEGFDQDRKLVENWIQQLLRPHLQYSQELPDVIENLAIDIVRALAKRK